jgi:hypothetical protein
MDKFIIRGRKNTSIFSDIPAAICVWGPHGCGKTTWAKKTFDLIEINYNEPAEFMSRVQNDRWVLIDNYESLDHQIYEDFYTRKNTMFISKTPVSEMYCYEFPNKDMLIKQFGKMDIFKEPKELILENIQNKKDSYFHLIGDCEGEHGNNIGIIEENVIQSKLDIDKLVRVYDSLSLASIVDEKMYQGNWDLFQIFNAFGYVIPCHIIKGEVTTSEPASMWTKFLNMCMRQKKLKELKIDAEEIQLLREYALQGQNPIKLSKQNIDILKYGDFYGKIKHKHIQKLKNLASA